MPPAPPAGLVTIVHLPVKRRFQYALTATSPELAYDAIHHPLRVKAHLIGLAANADPDLVENPDEILVTISMTTVNNTYKMDALRLPPEVVAGLQRVHTELDRKIVFIPDESPNIRVSRIDGYADSCNVESPMPGANFMSLANSCASVLQMEPAAVFASPSLRSVVTEAHASVEAKWADESKMSVEAWAAKREAIIKAVEEARAEEAATTKAAETAAAEATSRVTDSSQAVEARASDWRARVSKVLLIAASGAVLSAYVGVIRILNDPSRIQAGRRDGVLLLRRAGCLGMLLLLLRRLSRLRCLDGLVECFMR